MRQPKQLLEGGEPMSRPWKVPLRKNRKLQGCLAASLALHLLVIFGITHREQVAQFPVLQPIMVEFTKRPPPQRTLTRRQRPRQRPLVRRPALQAAPVAAVRPAPTATRPLPMFKSAALRLPMAALPDRLVLPVPDFPARHIGPQMQAGALEGTRQGADEIDLALELMDVQAMDTGRHRAMVVMDPKDRRELKGFLYLSSVYSPSIERAERERPNSEARLFLQTRQMAEKQMLQGLADKMVASTQVHVEVRDAVRLDDPQLLQVPFVLFTANAPFEFTAAESANLGAYLTSGGFLFAEIVRLLRPNYSDADLDIPAMRSLIRASFQAVGYQEWKDWQFARLETTHSIYHSFYDVESLPRGMRDMHFTTTTGGEYPQLTPDYLEGILVGEQLVGVYSMRGYADFWSGIAERARDEGVRNNISNTPFFLSSIDEMSSYNLGVNLVVYALTREGSLARRLVAAD